MKYAPNAFWFSKVQAARKCLRYYKLTQLDGIKQDGPQSADLEFGTAMHLGINGILKADPDIDGVELFNLYWGSVESTPMEFSRLKWADLRACGNTLLERFKRLHAKHFEPFRMEERIFTQVGRHSFEGTPDFVGKYKGIPSVVDFKTSAMRYPKERIVSDDQIPIYAHLAEKDWDYPTQQGVYVVLIKDPKEPSIQVLTTALTKDTITYSISNVTEEIDDLAVRTTFPKNPTACMRGTYLCPMFQRCHGTGENSE
jgi:hypothetical protein